METSEENKWFEDVVDVVDDVQIEEYDITAAPNDFNILTIYNFLESGAVKIPGFQRNYVWDIGRASKLIESLVLGIPVPQLFLYESDRNSFLVIDGQQRLMSIYYFVKKRFPLKERRSELRMIFDEKGTIPDAILHDDKYFEDFKLKLPEKNPSVPNKFKGLNYATLGTYKTQFDLRTIRNIIIKQNAPQDDDSSIYEVFNRLNTGGMNLTPQEIRMSMYHSSFYELLYTANTYPSWRRLLPSPDPDIHLKDMEVLLRGFSLLVDIDNYAPSMVRFLNQFSRKARKQTPDQNTYLIELLKSFLKATEALPQDTFLNKKNRRFNIALFEAVFAGCCRSAFNERRLITGTFDATRIAELERDEEFLEAMREGTTQTKNVSTRVSRAKAIVGDL